MNELFVGTVLVSLYDSFTIAILYFPLSIPVVSKEYAPSPFDTSNGL